MARRSRKRVRPSAGRTGPAAPAARPAAPEARLAPSPAAAAPPADPPPAPPAPSDAAPAAASAPTAPGPPEAPRRVRGAERDALLRAELQPLAPGERPAVLVVATVVCLVLAGLSVAGYLTHTGLGGQKPQFSGLVIIVAVLLLAAVGLWRCRYWAVLGFEALLAFQVLVASLSLAVASNWLAAILCLSIIGFGGWLFWKLVKIMGRLQVPRRERAA